MVDVKGHCGTTTAVVQYVQFAVGHAVDRHRSNASSLSTVLKGPPPENEVCLGMTLNIVGELNRER